MDRPKKAGRHLLFLARPEDDETEDEFIERLHRAMVEGIAAIEAEGESGDGEDA